MNQQPIPSFSPPSSPGLDGSSVLQSSGSYNISNGTSNGSSNQTQRFHPNPKFVKIPPKLEQKRIEIPSKFAINAKDQAPENQPENTSDDSHQNSNNFLDGNLSWDRTVVIVSSSLLSLEPGEANYFSYFSQFSNGSQLSELRGGKPLKILKNQIRNKENQKKKKIDFHLQKTMG